jgi:dTDP-4-dehydrorhamnose reductase
MSQQTTIFTGGSGLLGSEFRKIAPEFRFPDAETFDVTNYSQMERYAMDCACRCIIHAAAFTSPPLIDKDPLKALEVNIIGTAHIVRLCMKLNVRLIYVCTDYVFSGDRGLYAETDPVSPVNKYAWSKLGGECAARLFDRALVIRTSFGPDRFPYDRAFADQWTSREPVSVIARKLKALADSELTGVIHVGGPRRTVLEYARSLDGTRQVGSLSIKDVSFSVPVDTSLDCGRYDRIFSSRVDKQ